MMLHGRPPSSDAWGWYTPRPRTFHPIGGRPPGSAAHLRQAHYLISRTGCSHPTPTLSTIAARPGTSSSSGPGRSCPSAYATGPMGSDQRKLVLARVARLGADDAEGFVRSLDEAVGETITADYWTHGLVSALEIQKARAPAALAFRAAQVVLGTRALCSDQLLRNLLEPSGDGKRAAGEAHHLF